MLREGESLSSFMLEALQRSIAVRRDQEAFLARGRASSARARLTGRYLSSAQVLDGLSRRLALAKKNKRG